MPNLKYCTKCGKELNHDKSCAFCDVADNNQANSNGKLIFIPIVIIIIFSIVVIMWSLNRAPTTVVDLSPVGNSGGDMSVGSLSKNTQLLTTNPAYRFLPDDFIVDTENIISDLPDDNKSVWVEEVLGEHTISVSYIILKDGEQFITFAKVDIFSLEYILSECKENEAIRFIKKFIEHKYVYLSGGHNDYNAFDKKHISKIISILKNDIDITDKINQTGNSIDVNQALVRLGYGIPTDSMFSSPYRQKLINYREVAEVAKRGFWGICQE